MKHRYHPKKKKWSDLSRREQRQRWIAMRWLIQQQVHLGGHGVYWTDEYESPTEELHPLENQWSDIYVPDPDGHTIWNMTVVTLRQELWDQAKRLAEERIEAKMTEDEQRLETQRLLSAFSFQRVSGSKLHRMIGHFDAPLHESLDGKTKSQAVEEETQRILEDEKLRVSESWTVDHDYRYGIGVHAVVATSQLTPVTISAFLGRFFQNKPWSVVVPEQWYPKSSEHKEHQMAKESVFLLQSKKLKI